MGAPHEFDGGRRVNAARPSRPKAPMSFPQHVLFWSAAVVVAGLVLWVLSPVLLPFIVGIVLAYLLNPVTNRLQRLGVNRTVAALLVVTLFVLAFVLLILIIAPIVGNQLAAFVEKIPEYIRRVQELLTDPSRPWLRNLVGEGVAGADKAVGDLLTQGAGWLATFLKSLWSGGAALLSLFSLLVVMPVVAFYLICDWPRMLETADALVPAADRPTVRKLAHEIDDAIVGFVRGQSAVCLILGAFYAVALSLAGLNFGLLIGLISGLLTFIPYVGSMTGLVLSVGVAVAQFWPDWGRILIVLGIFLFGQFVEGNVLAPKLVGESVGLHPVWLIFALFAFGYLFGFIGLLLAVPLAAAVGVLVRFALRRYRASALSTGEPG
jgi:predicted PurR-regulated permease PerM